MKMEADLHIHTIASGHAYSTVKEIAEAAADKGLKLIAITDHGLNMPGAPHLYHFTNMINLPYSINGVAILRGVEANILNVRGEIDMPYAVLESSLDIVLAGFHESTGYAGSGIEQNTEAMIAAIKNPFVHVIVHPGNGAFPVHIEKVVMAAKSYNKAIELNNNSPNCRPKSGANCMEFAKMAQKHGALVAINSDAHICYSVGEMEDALRMALAAGISEKQIINSSAEKVREYLIRHKRQILHSNPA